MGYTQSSIAQERERHLRSKERREYMRRQKKLQLKRRRLTILFLRIGARFFVIFAVIFMGIMALKQVGGILFAKEAGTQFQAEQEAEGQADDPLIIEEIAEQQDGQKGLAEEGENTSFSFNRAADTKRISGEGIVSSYAILIDESTDTVVASKASEERISPASMTKVLTVLVAAEHIQEENLDDWFTMTTEITDYGYINGCSEVGFLDTETVTVRDLFYGTILPSGSDAALGLATYVAGSHEAFVEMMNAKLEKLGLSDSAHFTNCVGLYHPEHYCTVYDMAVIMKAAIGNEICREVLSARTYTTSSTAEHPQGIEISNWFIRRIEDKDTGGEVVCAKTGYVVQSGSCAVSYGYFGGKYYICVTADSTSSWRCIYDHVEIYQQYIPA